MRQPKLETRMIPAMRRAAEPPGAMASTAAVATRSCGAPAMRATGRAFSVADVGQEIERAHEARAQEQGARHVSFGLAHLLRQEGHVVPGVGRKQGLDRGHREGPEQRRLERQTRWIEAPLEVRREDSPAQHQAGEESGRRGPGPWPR